MPRSAQTSGSMLTVTDLDEVAVRIGEMWSQYNTERRAALSLGEEARRFVFATDIDSTSAALQPHKNRTHQPKLTEINDTLQSKYFEAALGSPEFFRFNGSDIPGRSKSRLVEAWVRTKLETKKFRETVGRALLMDYAIYGNCFADVDYVRETDSNGNITYVGIVVRRISPLDIVFNNRAKDFSSSVKIERALMHISDIAELPEKFPESEFNETAIQKAIKTRHPDYAGDWIEVIKERGINMDGYGSWDEYFKQDMAELLIYRGSVFDPITGETKTNRVVFVMDRIHVIRDAPSRSPMGFDGLHHAGWRIRPDNLWAQGPLDNLVGMQYRIDHLENLKADGFDLIIQPNLLIKGEGVQEPEDGFAPGGTYYAGVDEDVSFLVPDVGVLQADSGIAVYHQLMEQFAGVPSETRGIRTPGEKTAFEIDKLDNNANGMFIDKTRNFEILLEGILKEAHDLMLINFDENDYIEIFDDIENAEIIKEVSRDQVTALGQFIAVGSQHWARRQRRTQEMQTLQLGPMQDPKINIHISGINLAKFYEEELNLEDHSIVEPFIGVKESVQAEAIAEAERQKLQQETGEPTGPAQPVQPGQGPAPAGASPTGQFAGTG